MDKRYYDEMVQNFIESESIIKGKTIYLFGHCEATITLADFLIERAIIPKAILDNSNQKQGGYYKDIPIVEPNAAISDASRQAVVLIVTRFYEAMNAQLRKLGFKGQIIKLVDYNTYAEYSLSEDTISRKTKRLEAGVQRLEIIKRENANSLILLCPFNALGDIYFAMEYLPAFMQKRGFKNVVICVPSKVCGDVASIFAYTNIMVIQQRELDAVIQAAIYSKDEQCFIAHQDRPYIVNLHKILKSKKISLEQIYCCGVYGLAAEAKPAIPGNWSEYSRLSEIPIGKAVIISPYAKSVTSFSSGFWEEIVKDYISKGYQIYTNVAGDEQPLKGTKPISPQINEMKSVVERAGLFIGIRSGLCDILRTANCRKIALYPDYNYCDTQWKSIDMYAIDGFENIVVDGDFKWKK